MTSRCVADGAPGHLWRRTQPEAVQWSVDSRGVPEKQCLRKDQPHGWVETVGAGARSQSASGCCSGGVSAVISASDLDAVTLRRFCWLAYPCKGALPSDGKGPKVRAACLMPSPLLISHPFRCLVFVSLLLLAACGGDRPEAEAERQRAAAQARIQRCLEATDGRMPTLFAIDSSDEPAIRPTPAPCRGIERQAQQAVYAKTMQDCAKATGLLSDPAPSLPEKQRQWAQQQLRRCVGSDPNIFYW